MSDFLSRSSATPPADMVARKEAMMNAVRQEMAIQNAQELMNVGIVIAYLRTYLTEDNVMQKANERCYAKCVPKPGDSLSSSEQMLDRYLEAFNIVSRAYTARIGKERDARQAAGL
ncbi:hypothetical protein BDZ97DRAFT_1823535 [Flammula alnicola]|nr:hypothetical protein BDZ97DRAFT_1823535 [Flammula alnicola]